MNVPVTPTVELSSLANLEKIDTDLAKRSGASWKSVAKPLAFAGAGLLAWRFAPLLAEAVRPKRRSKTPWIVAGVGLAVGAGALAWQLQRLFTAEPDLGTAAQRSSAGARRVDEDLVVRPRRLARARRPVDGEGLARCEMNARELLAETIELLRVEVRRIDARAGAEEEPRLVAAPRARA